MNCASLSSVFLAFTALAPASWLELQRVPGTGVSLEVPGGYEPAANFAGFIDLETGASLAVVELPVSWVQNSRVLRDEGALARQGIEVRERTQLSQGEHPGELLRAVQRTTEGSFHKWIWGFGDARSCVMVLGTCPKGLGPAALAELRAAVVSAAWEPELAARAEDRLPYAITDEAGMLALGTATQMLAYTSDGEADEEKSGKPSFLCTPSVRPFSGDRERFPLRRARAMPHVEEVEVERQRPVVIDGLPGQELVARVTREEGAGERFLHLVVLYEGDAYWILSGTAAPSYRADYLPRFERMARSFRRRWETLDSEAAACRIEVPATWSVRAGLNEEADLQAAHGFGSPWLLVMSERKRDFAPDVDYRAHSALTREDLVRAAKETRAPETIEVGGRRALACEFVVEEEGRDLLYRHLTVDGRRRFHQVLLCAPAERREELAADLARIEASFLETEE